jgi:hypothetical protein
MKRLLNPTSIIVTSVVIFPLLLMARSGFLSDFNSQYGTANTILDACTTCHGESKSIRNPYGQDHEAQLNAGFSPLQGFLNIENYDSDGDSFSNIEEILALTLPGDAGSTPGGGGGPMCTDGDGDSYAVEGADCGPVDCNDSNPSVNPDAFENCTNGIDDDCDGLIDGNDSECGACIPTTSRERGKKCSDGVDNDCDGLIDADDPDCGGGDTGGGGGGSERGQCSDGIDNDGDGKVDCADKKDCGKDPVCN